MTRLRRGFTAAALAALTTLAGFAAPGAARAAATSYYQEGLKLLKAERYQEAVAAFEKEAAENPGNAEVLMNLGWSYWKVNRIDDAWRCFDLLAKLDPKNATYLRFLAETEVTRKEFPHALAHAENALKLLPGDKDASIVMSSALVGLKRHNEADRILRDLAARYPDSGPVQFHMADNLAAMGKLDEALRHFDIVVHLDPQNADYRRARANVLYAVGQEAAAVAEWKALADATPPDQKSLINLGWDAAKHRDFELAYAYGKRLLRLDPRNPTYLKFLGNVQLERGDGVDALRYAQAALDALGKDKDASLLKAKAFFMLMRDKEAMAVLEALMRDYPDNRQIVFNMGDFLDAMGRGEEALVFYERLVKADPDNLVYRYRRAAVYYELGEFDSATKEWKKITQQYPAEVKALTLLADDAISRKAYDEALLFMQEKALRQSLDSEGWGTLVQIYYDLKSYPLALAAADKALKMDPGDVNLHFQRAEILEAMGDYDGAAAENRLMLQRNPNSLRALAALGRLAEYQGDYDRAIRLTHSMRKLSFSDSTSSPYYDILEARLLADSGRVEKAMRVLKKKATHERISIPVLLYHGVSRFGRGDRMSVTKARFAEHMEAIKKAGYEAITLAQLADYWDGRGSLPDKPIVISFDDARSDAFKNGDPVLAQNGLKATMFVHLTAGFHRNRYYASGPQIAQWNRTGRWEIQGHSYMAHESIQIDRQGHMGHFLSNRMWLKDKNRLETVDEFRARVDSDFKTSREKMEKMFPGSKIVAYAFPFGDMGQNDFTNAPEAPTVNWTSVHHYYKFSFTQDPYGFNRIPTKVTDMGRWEVQKDYTARDVVHHLVMEEPFIKAKMMEADFWIRTDQPGRSLSIYRMLRTKYGIQDGALYGGEALAFDMFGNGYVARKKWKKATELDPGNDKYRELAAFSAARDTPRLETSGQYFSDAFTHNTSMKASYSQPIMAARVEPFVGRTIFSQPGQASLTASELGGSLRWFLSPRVRLDAEGTNRSFADGTRRVTQSGNAQLTFPFFAPFRLGVKGGRNDVATLQGESAGLYYTALGGLAEWDVAMNTTFSLDAEQDRYSDANKGQTGSALLLRRFGKFFTAGYGFRYLHTDFRSSSYWSPNRSTLHRAIAGVNGYFGAIDERRNVHRGSGSLTYSLGYGNEDGRGRVVNGVKATLGYRVLGDLSANVMGDYSQSPTYTSRTIGAGVGLDF